MQALFLGSAKEKFGARIILYLPSRGAERSTNRRGDHVHQCKWRYLSNVPGIEVQWREVNSA
jgi:hypothetical protein